MSNQNYQKAVLMNLRETRRWTKRLCIVVEAILILVVASCLLSSCGALYVFSFPGF